MPTTTTRNVAVNHIGEIMAFKSEHGLMRRLFFNRKMATVHPGEEKHPVRYLTNLEIEYLKILPNGGRPLIEV